MLTTRSATNGLEYLKLQPLHSSCTGGCVKVVVRKQGQRTSAKTRILNGGRVELRLTPGQSPLASTYGTMVYGLSRILGDWVPKAKLKF